MKKGNHQKKRGLSGVNIALAATAIVALVLYLSGGVSVYRPNRSLAADMARNVETLAAMEAQEPVDLEAAAKAKYKAMLDARKGIMVDDLVAEKQKILTSEPGTKAQLAKWFSSSAIVGDSIIKGAEVYGLLGRPPVFGEIGLRAVPDLEILDAVEAAKPKVIFLCFGMNDLEMYGEKVHLFTQHYTELIHRLQASLPDSVIYVNALFVYAESARSKHASYKYRDTYNSELRAVCEREDAYFIDSNFIMENKPELYEKDGVHAVAKYYPYLLTYFADIAGLTDNE